MPVHTQAHTDTRIERHPDIEVDLYAELFVNKYGMNKHSVSGLTF